MEEDKGFEIKDRRSRIQDTSEESSPSAPDAKEEAVHSERPAGGGPRAYKALPPITLTSFILSLATSGLMQLGQEAHPQNSNKSADLAMARQTIDLLALLQEKTKGNLTSEEEAQLSQTLYLLRMTFVEVEKKG